MGFSYRVAKMGKSLPDRPNREIYCTIKVEINQLIKVSKSFVFVGFFDIYKWQLC